LENHGLNMLLDQLGPRVIVAGVASPIVRLSVAMSAQTC
jgi:hypothetical protein